ncbi:Apoptosis-inducing factor 1 [Sparassis crispa]|uniref:Apoptosis-inducing factor 1 n=1 Tax=Sparassis crispa TaxID=139825 RepID=A0A401H2B4_9APHY|nr:Apoptosis-inducing factor 1 [Sparassis crispa]GBE88532.1 Apoptosis-inducing factor 1 [Sparassis crispa]
MSAKTIAVLDESELKDGDMKQVDFEGEGKILLSRLGDKIHATSAFCTHYGAPLAKGVLTADGRVVCPWHGACFNVCTGDIEDAPAPAALHLFKAHVSGGKIHVTADPSSTVKANLARQPKIVTSLSQGKGVVIVGGGSGTYHCIESLREFGYSGPITVISKEPHSPIDRTKLSKALLTDPSKLEWRSVAELTEKYGVNFRLNTEVTDIDSATNEVVIGGNERVPYETLVLATGGVPRRLPIEGRDLSNVFTMRGIADTKKIDAAVQGGKRLVVIGSSFISMELVVAVASRKLASIDVIGQEEVPFETILGKRIGNGLQKFHQSKGVKFHMQSQVEKIVASRSDPSKAEAVIVKSSSGETTTLSADVVIMGVGVAPATEYLKSSKGFEKALDKSGAVLVDEYLRVKGVNDVFAIGDIAMYPQPGTGELRRVEHWNVAGNQGRAAGKTISGAEPQPFVKVPIFWSAQGQQLRYCGVGSGFDDVIIDGNPDEMKFIAYYVKNDKIIAVSSMQRDPVVSKASELLRLGLMPSPAEIRAGKDLLSVDIQTVAANTK